MFNATLEQKGEDEKTRKKGKLRSHDQNALLMMAKRTSKNPEWEEATHAS